MTAYLPQPYREWDHSPTATAPTSSLPPASQPVPPSSPIASKSHSPSRQRQLPFKRAYRGYGAGKI